MIINENMYTKINDNFKMKLNIPSYNDPHRVIFMDVKKTYNCRIIVDIDSIKVVNYTLLDKIYITNIKQDFIYENFGNYDVDKFFDMIYSPIIFENFSRIMVIVWVDNEYKSILLDAYEYISP